MKYVSTSGRHSTGLNGAVAKCIAPDGTLYLPERLPVIPRAFLNNIEEMTMKEIAYVVVTSFLGGDVSPAILKQLVDETFIYNIPVRPLADGVDIVELFDGPTLAFKDFSAAFVANFVKLDEASDLPKVALVATTGNTGAAVANAFARKRDRRVVVLFPRGALSRSQLAQFTTVGDNVHAIEVAGDIGRCKQIVREAMADESLADSMSLINVNTTNFMRLIPQVVFYFYAYARLKERYGHVDGFTPSIPCGNLSSLTSAVIARRIGLPIGRIVAGCNANDDLVRVLSGELSPEKVNVNSRPTLARAMDSGYPTNLGRLMRLYDNDPLRASKEITAIAVLDDEIKSIIKETSDRGTLVDPHTAVAIGALTKAGLPAGIRSVVMATAHPAKSLDTITDITGRAIELPLQLTRFMNKGVSPTKIPPTYAALKKHLLKIIS